MKYRVLRRLLHEYFKGAGGDWSSEERSRWGSSGVYMAKILLAASVVEAAGESSRLALPVPAALRHGRLQGRLRKLEAEQGVANSS